MFVHLVLQESPGLANGLNSRPFCVTWNVQIEGRKLWTPPFSVKKYGDIVGEETVELGGVCFVTISV